MTFPFKNVCFSWFLLFYCITAMPIDAAVLDWIWGSTDVNTNEVIPKVTVPYESKTEDEKFLEEALKFTDIMKSSDLDVCQHNVVLKIKTSCSSMTEEEMGKLSVNLLNCQSSVDGRKTFPCTEDMTLKQCTVTMDPMMWNSYHLMNNRARAVCYASRRAQFQALSELTVNKLLSTAQDQVSRLSKLQEGQDELELMAANTLGTIKEGNVDIMLQQNQIKTAQSYMQSSVLTNLKELSREKSLIAAGNRELDIIKKKLDETNKELVLQSMERSGHHQKVITDIETIQRKADEIFQRIDESTSKLLAYHKITSTQYEETLGNLEKINKTIGYLAHMFATSHTQLEMFLGENAEDLARRSSAVKHLAYLMAGMLVASFLQLPLVSRIALSFIVPVNLLLVLDEKTELVLDFTQISVLLVVITLVNVFVNFVLSFMIPSKPQYFIMDSQQTRANGIPAQPAPETFFQKTMTVAKRWALGLWCWLCSLRGTDSRDEVDVNINGNNGIHDSMVSSTGREPEDNNTTIPQSGFTPFRRKNEDPLNRVSHWIDNSRFSPREGTPLSTASVRSGSPRLMCSAMCRTGRRCRKPSTPGREHCRLHEAGTSVMS